MDQPTAEQALRQLKPLVGEWIFASTGELAEAALAATTGGLLGNW